MTALDHVPTDRNFLNPVNFTFQIKRAPAINFFVQSVNVPGFAIPNSGQATPFVKIPKPGDHISYQDLEISFKVDEALQNYFEIYNWMKALGFPDNTAQYKNLAVQDKSQGLGIYSDIQLLVLSSNRNPIFVVNFLNCFPYSLGSLQFDTRPVDIDYVACTAAFKYQTFNVEAIT
jgi:hypothetical protein